MPRRELRFLLALSVAAAGWTLSGAARAQDAAEADPALRELKAFIAEKAIDKSAEGWREKLPQPPTATFAAMTSRYRWKLETNKGAIEIELLPQVAPAHVSNTIYLTLLGFYDGLSFHRVIPGFMAQAGCPKGDGTGDPGYKFGGEIVPEATHAGRGVLSTAHAGEGTDGSQFFITFQQTTWLDGKYTVFGNVVSGMDTLGKLEAAGTPKTGKPTEPLRIEKATIHVAPVDAAVGKVVEFITEQLEAKKIDKSNERWRTSLPQPPQVEFPEGKEWSWTLDTNKGRIRIRLMPDVAPMHVSSTLYLALLGYYDGLVFHRVIPGFMAQGGCPLGTGTGGPGYKYGGEFSPNVRHDRPGLLSMANAGPGTDGSQFFLTFKATPWLDDRHTIFGEVVEGSDVLERLEAAGSQSGKTKERLAVARSFITTVDKAK